MEAKSRAQFFDWGAFGYDVLTGQEYWRKQIVSVLDHARIRPGAKITLLDLGCGPGVSTFALAEKLGKGHTLAGIDLALKMLVRARNHQVNRFSNHKRILFSQADAVRLPFADNTFNLAVGHSFLYLVPDRLGVLRDVVRVLAPGGCLILMEPNAEGSLPLAALRSTRHVGELIRNPWSASRFALSMAGWRTVSAAAGRLSPSLVHDLFERAGFDSVECHPTLEGLGLHCVGRIRASK